jgi:general secretion pathway protein D
MRHVFNLFVLMLLAGGCAAVPKPETRQPSLRTLEDVGYRVDANGSVNVTKRYRLADGNATRRVTTSKPLSGGYERVPLFDRHHKKAVSIEGRRPVVRLSGDRVKISVESIPLNEFVDLVFGNVLKLNYTVGEAVKKLKTPVSLNMQRPQKTRQLYEVAKKILSLNGVGVREQDGTLFVYKTGKKAEALSDVYIGYGRTLPAALDDDREVMLFVPYDYTDPNSAVNVIRQAGIGNVRFYFYLKGIQAMRGKAGDIRKALQIIDMIDRPYLKGKTPYLVDFENIEVDKFAAKMKEIFTLNGINVVTSPSKGGIVMLPIAELNALYVITPKKAWLDMLLYWKKKLDVETEVAEEPQLYIYHVKNRKADELADALKEVIGLSTTSRRGAAAAKGTKTPGAARTATRSKPKNAAGGDAVTLTRFDYTPTVSADLDTNIVMLKLKPRHYRLLLPFIRQLDRLPLQTLVEVTVAEVDMTDTFSLGFEYAIRSEGLGVKDLLNVSGGGSGLGVVFSGDRIDATINAFAEKKLLDIVSKPKILILNNTTGSINVGTQVPIITSETSAADISTGQTPSINRNITYRTTGINLGLTPTINSNGVLTMKIAISLSEAQLNDTSNIDSPLIVDRQLDTVAVVGSGDTILIGGLISRNTSKSKGGIPLLKDLPWIGDLFATNSDKVTKSELIMLIRPTIIRSPQGIRAETERFKTILRSIDIDTL